MSAENVVPINEEISSDHQDLYDENRHDELELGTTLMHGQYRITDFLNRGGFGITYLASDSLSRPVVIKECFPTELCHRVEKRVVARSRRMQPQLSSVIRGFVREAQNLATLEHPNIVGVHQIFEDNSTAYMAIDYVNGMDMLDLIEDDAEHLSPEQIVNITKKLLGAISFVHSNNILHRDISPDNILINTNGEPVLIDFGAAKEDATQKDRNLTALRVVKDGYSPQEFYVEGAEQGPWSDLYSFGASLFHVIDGKLPVNCQARLSSIATDKIDTYVPLAGRIEGYPPGFLEAIDKSMQVLPKHRIQSADEWLAMLTLEDTHFDAELRETVSGLAIRKKTRAGGAVGTAEDLRPARERSNTPLMAGAALMVLLVGAGAYVALQPSESVETVVLADEVAAVDDLPVAIAETPAEPEESVGAKPLEIADNTVPSVFLVSPEIADIPAAEEASLTVFPTPIATIETRSVPEEFETPELPVAAAQSFTTPPAALPQEIQIERNGLSFAVWNVAMPFEATHEKVRNANTATITKVHPRNLSPSDSWITKGAEIHIVNDTRLEDGVQLETYILNSMNLDPDGKTRASVMYKDAVTKRFERALLTVPIVRDIWLADGTQFHIRMDGDDWVAEVMNKGTMPGNELAVGDVISRETKTGIALNAPESMEQVFALAESKGLESLGFAVSRNGSTTTAILPLQSGSE